MRAAVRGATFELLDEVGYDRLQLPDVATRAGVNKTTVYRRWPSKVELLAELFTELAAADVPIPDTGALVDDLETLLREVAAILDRSSVRAVLRASITLAEDDHAARGARTAFWEHRLDRGATIVHRAIERGELPEGTDPRLFLEGVFGPLYLRKLIIGDAVDDAYLQGLARQDQT